MTDYKEFFMYCAECGKVTHWAFLEVTSIEVEGECMECSRFESFDSWSEVVRKSESD